MLKLRNPITSEGVVSSESFAPTVFFSFFQPDSYFKFCGKLTPCLQAAYEEKCMEVHATLKVAFTGLDEKGALIEYIKSFVSRSGLVIILLCVQCIKLRQAYCLCISSKLSLS